MRAPPAGRRCPAGMTRSICFVDSVPTSAAATAAELAEREARLAQPFLLGQAFRELGLDVTVVVHSSTLPAGCSAAGLRLIGLPGRTDGRRQAGGAGAVLEALQAADADLYFETRDMRGPLTVSRFCRRQRRRHLVRLRPGVQGAPSRRGSARAWVADSLGARAVRQADLVAVHHAELELALQQAFEVSATVVHTAVAMPAAPLGDERDIDALWMGATNEPLCAELTDALARAHGTARLRPVTAADGPPRNGAAPVTAARAQHGTDNAAFAALLARSRLLLSVGDEGCTPEAWHVAWAHGVPVAALTDPDDLLARHGLGVTADSPRDLGRTVGQLLGDAEALAGLAARCRKYALGHFSAAAIAQRYAALFGFSAARYRQRG